ncbi:MAG: hypothetical protein V3R57_05995 [Candidatus Bathyarchaeia archaeon]|jgi:uncharacterized membrane protein YeaQ/YmgE (transglycosylase-associated protein family)
MVLIGVLAFLLLQNILNGDFFNGIINLVIIGIAGSALLQRLKSQEKQKKGE